MAIKLTNLTGSRLLVTPGTPLLFVFSPLELTQDYVYIQLPESRPIYVTMGGLAASPTPTVPVATATPFVDPSTRGTPPLLGPNIFEILIDGQEMQILLDPPPVMVVTLHIFFGIDRNEAMRRINRGGLGV